MGSKKMVPWAHKSTLANNSFVVQQFLQQDSRLYTQTDHATLFEAMLC